MNISAFGRVVDERFLNHRLRSTSLAGIIGGLTAIGLLAYRFYWDHVWSWDLFIVATTIVMIKLAAVAWYRLSN